MDNGVKVEFFDADLVEQIVDANREFIEHYERVSEDLLIIDSSQPEPTICGMLLFGKNPDLFLPHCKVKVVWYARETTRNHLVDDLKFPPKDFCGPLAGIIDETVGFLKDNLNKVLHIEGTKRIEIMEYLE